MLVINCKNYVEVSSPKKLLQLGNSALKASKKYKTKIAISPPPHMCTWLAQNSKITVLAQHVDIQGTGSTTGYVIPEMLAKSKIAGAIINHSEHRVPISHIREAVNILSKLNLRSIVCAKKVSVRQNGSIDSKFCRISPQYLIQLAGPYQAITKDQWFSRGVAKANLLDRMLCGANLTG